MKYSKLSFAALCLYLLTGFWPGVGHPARKFVGSAECSDCHTEQYEAWKGSHHDLAMQHASDESVLGDFNNAEFTYNELTSSFFRKEGKFFVNTDGKDGTLQDFEIRYTLGVIPLQQYLVEFPDGRVQALSIAWDSRSEVAGGQRWFHLYPDEAIDAEDELHWTGPQQNWNYMCADCHTTNLKKGYSSASDTFNTTWSEINVGCEACHGPGNQHLSWAALGDELKSEDINQGLAFILNDRENASWPIDPHTGTALRSTPNSSRKEIQQCARCHSRRSSIKPGAESDTSFMDHYMPALLAEGLYHDDGQILGEVYVWGSFTQSKMYAAGVTCSDCHKPHNLQLRDEGDAVCAQCHLPAKFAAKEHHHHQTGSAGANCLSCHMPETTYMVVDARRDHSIRIPRPDHSLEFDTPNACNRCHVNQSTQWAAENFTNWYPRPIEPFQTWTKAFHSARQNSPSAAPLLTRIINDLKTPDIARATALFELRNYLSPASGNTLQTALNDGSPLVRLAALQTLEGFAPQSRYAMASGLLEDPVLAVRIEAGRVLAEMNTRSLSPDQRSQLSKAVAEYITAQQVNADRVESQVNLGNLYVNLGDPVQAEQKFRLAIRLDPKFIPVYINLSDLYRGQGMNDQALKVLNEGIAVQPDSAALHHSLGLALVRQGNTAIALAALKKAVNLAPEAARYAYVYGVALNSSHQAEAGISSLEESHKLHPTDREILFALTTINRDLGRINIAAGWAEKLVELNPSDADAQQLLQSLIR